MRTLERSERRLLLAIARAAIEEAVCADVRLTIDPATLPAAVCAPAAAFVTLRKHGELRGCIGTLLFDAPLWRNVRDAAVSAALHDPRFRPVRAAELPELELEVSVLDPPVPISDPACFEAGRHGIVVERGRNRALLLPQVATEMGWDARQMLEAVCEKAWLPPTAWQREGTRLFVFESVCFSEAGVTRGTSGADAEAGASPGTGGADAEAGASPGTDAADPETERVSVASASAADGDR